MNSKKAEKSVFEGCYAKHLGGCTHATGEHYISKAVLKILEPIYVENFPWQLGGERKNIGIAALTASVLCDHHNSSLSDYDTEAAKFFSYLKEIDSKDTPLKLAEFPENIQIDGVRIEKWFLKCMCGVMASGNYRIFGKAYEKIMPHSSLVNMLFNDKPWGYGAGLYPIYENGGRVNGFRGLSFNPVVEVKGTNAKIFGFDMHLWGFPLRCLFIRSEPMSEGYHPRWLKFVNGEVVRHINFNWPVDFTTTDGPTFTRDGTLF